MSDVLSFSEDMLPRYFPKIHRSKSSQPFDEAAVPQPTVPSVSLICSNENRVKPQHMLRNWNDQYYHAVVQNDTMHHQSKSVKKHVRFANKSDDINRCISNERNDSGVRSKLECTFLASKATDYGKQMTLQTNRLTSEIMREIGLRQPPRHYNNQTRGNGPRQISNLQADNNAIFGPSEVVSEQRSQSHSSYEILLNILEEQQHHISMQRNHILMQEKQNLEQQKEICMLEYQIEQLLLQKETVVLGGYNQLNVTETTPTKDKFPVEVPLDVDWKLSELSENLNNGNVASHFGISEVTNVALSSFVFDGTCGEAKSAIFYNKINETIPATTHSSVCVGNSTQSSSYGQSQWAMDRSVVLNMLRMKYKCLEADAQRFSGKDFSDVSFDVNDYFVRHGLIKQQN